MSASLLNPKALLKVVYDIQSLRCVFLWALSRVAHAKDIATPEMLQALEIEISPGDLERIITTEEELQFTWELCTQNPKEFCNQILLHSKTHSLIHKLILGAEAILITFTVADMLLTEYSMHQINKQLGKSQTSLKKELDNILQFFDMACNWHSVSEAFKINARSRLNNLILKKIIPLSNEVARMEGMAEERRKSKAMMMSLDGAMFLGSLLTFNGWETFSNAKKAFTGMFSGMLLGGMLVEGAQWMQLRVLCNHLLHFTALLEDIRQLACYALDPQPGSLQEQNAKGICNELVKINHAETVEVDKYLSPFHETREERDDEEPREGGEDQVEESTFMWW